METQLKNILPALLLNEKRGKLAIMRLADRKPSIKTLLMEGLAFNSSTIILPSISHEEIQELVKTAKQLPATITLVEARKPTTIPQENVSIKRRLLLKRLLETFNSTLIEIAKDGKITRKTYYRQLRDIYSTIIDMFSKQPLLTLYTLKMRRTLLAYTLKTLIETKTSLLDLLYTVISNTNLTPIASKIRDTLQQLTIVELYVKETLLAKMLKAQPQPPYEPMKQYCSLTLTSDTEQTHVIPVPPGTLDPQSYTQTAIKHTIQHLKHLEEQSNIAILTLYPTHQHKKELANNIAKILTKHENQNINTVYLV